jgi:hypothetical protein
MGVETALKVLDRLMSGITARQVLVYMLRALPIDFLKAVMEMNKVSRSSRLISWLSAAAAPAVELPCFRSACPACHLVPCPVMLLYYSSHALGITLTPSMHLFCIGECFSIPTNSWLGWSKPWNLFVETV